MLIATRTLTEIYLSFIEFNLQYKRNSTVPMLKCFLPILICFHDSAVIQQAFFTEMFLIRVITENGKVILPAISEYELLN